jgi:hypothetical protein
MSVQTKVSRSQQLIPHELVVFALCHSLQVASHPLLAV